MGHSTPYRISSHSEIQSICNLVLHLGLWEALSQTHPSCPSASHDLHRAQVRPPPLGREERQACGKVPMAEFLLDWSAGCFCWVDGFELHGWIFDNLPPFQDFGSHQVTSLRRDACTSESVYSKFKRDKLEGLSDSNAALLKQERSTSNGLPNLRPIPKICPATMQIPSVSTYCNITQSAAKYFCRARIFYSRS